MAAVVYTRVHGVTVQTAPFSDITVGITNFTENFWIFGNYIYKDLLYLSRVILKIIINKSTWGYGANLHRSLRCSLVDSSRHGTKSSCSTNDVDCLGALRVQWARKKDSTARSGTTALIMSFQLIILGRLRLCLLSIKWTASEENSQNMSF